MYYVPCTACRVSNACKSIKWTTWLLLNNQTTWLDTVNRWGRSWFSHAETMLTEVRTFHCMQGSRERKTKTDQDNAGQTMQTMRKALLWQMTKKRCSFVCTHCRQRTGIGTDDDHDHDNENVSPVSRFILEHNW